MRLGLGFSVGLAVVVAGWTGGEAALGATPARPWQWTAAAASRAVVAWNPAVYQAEPGFDVKLTAAACAGVGPRVAGRFTSFRCGVTFKPQSDAQPVRRTLWLRVRRQGAGQPCVSLAGLSSIPAGCVERSGPRRPGSTREAERAFLLHLKELGRPYFGLSFSCTGFGAGFYRCAPPGGWVATVTFGQGDPAVRVVREPA